MSRKDDSFFVMFVGGKPEVGDNGGGFASVFLGLLAIALAMVFFSALMRDADRQRQNYYPQNYYPRSYYPSAQPIPLQPAQIPGNTVRY